jgi:Mg-chelatase subunit ChlD
MSNNNGNSTSRTRIALVLDRSGSMSSIQEPARDAFNEAISRVQSDAANGAGAGMQTTLSVVTFNHQIEDVLLNAAVDKVRPLGRTDYQPDGMTALFDATGHAIDVLDKAGPLGKRDAALVIVISDGHENASQRVSQKDLVERMQKLEATEQWTFSFLMANVDITKLSDQMGTEASNYAAWDADAAGAVDMKAKLAKGVSDYMVDRRVGVRSKKEFFEEERTVRRPRRDSGRDRS